MSEENSSGMGESSAPEMSESSESVESQGMESGSAEGSQEAQLDAIAEAVESGELTQAEAKSMMKKFQLKVNGRTIDKEIDLSDEASIRNELQLAAAARESMQSSAELKKLYQQEMLRLKNDPFSVLAELGIDVDDLSASHIERKIEHLKKSPEMIEKERIQEELKAAREEARVLKEAKEKAESEAQNKQTLAQITEEIGNAISAHKRLPNSEYIRRKVAQEMHWAANNGFPNVKAEDVLDSVEHQLRGKISGLFDELPEEMIEQYMGRKNIDRLQKKRIAATKVPSASQVKSTSASTQKSDESKGPKKPTIPARDFWK